MSTGRSAQQSLWRLTSRKPPMPSHFVARPGTNRLLQTNSSHIRAISTQKVTPKDSHQILIAQRKNRPVAPHLSIYKPQITSVLSSFQRITAVLLSGGLYIFGSAYVAAPLFGWHLDSASVAAAFGALPLGAKIAAKFALALPFTFHAFNGLRFLGWDAGKLMGNRQVVRTGWVVVVLSTAGAAGLALM